MRKINKEGLDLIKHFEGCKLEAYLDARKASPKPTIGYGHTGDVKIGDKITQDQADGFLEQDLGKFETGVEDLLDVDVNDNEFSALVCLAYNIGLYALRNSTLLRKLNAEDRQGAANSITLFVYAGGVVLEGLKRRREAEKALFLKEQEVCS